jgi:hypothetical protein
MRRHGSLASDAGSEASTATSDAATSDAATNAPSNADAASPPSDHGTRKMQQTDTPVYVDGSLRGVLRYGELPDIASYGAKVAPRFRFASYLQKIGVSLANIQRVDVFDQRDRVGSIEGDELRKRQDRFLFRFLAGQSGRVATAFDTVGMKNTYVVHEIRALAVYVNSAAPRLILDRQCLSRDGANCDRSLPTLNDEQSKQWLRSTRIYLDGRLIGGLKRRAVQETWRRGEASDGSPLFAVEPWLRATLAEVPPEALATPSSLPAKAGEPKAIHQKDATGRHAFTTATGFGAVRRVELVAFDALVGAGATFANESLRFALIPHGHGKIAMELPPSWQLTSEPPNPDRALVTAILLWSTAPKDRPTLPTIAVSEASERGAGLADVDGNSLGNRDGNVHDDVE